MEYQSQVPDCPVANLIFENPEIRIWLDERLDVWWDTKPSFESTLAKIKQNPFWGEIISKQAELEALPLLYLSEEVKRGFKFQVGNAILLLLTEQYEDAKKTMVAAESFYQARTGELARMWILESGATAVIAVSASFAISGFVGNALVSQESNLFEYVLLGGLAGSWGAFISLFLRATILGIDSSAGRKLHYMESVCRILTGFVAGGIVTCAIAAKILAPDLIQMGAAMIAVVGFAAGFSERILPSLVSKVESSTE